MLMSPMWSMAQVSDGLHVPTRSEVGPQAMPQTVAPVTAPFQFRLATIDRSKFEAARIMQQNYPLAKPQDQLTPSGLTGRVSYRN